MNKYKSDAPSIIPVPHEERSYLHTPKSGVIVPFLQSVLTAFLVTLVFMAATWAVNLRHTGKFAVLIFVVILFYEWRRHQRHWFGLTAVIENLTGLDLNHDNVIGEPPTIRVQIDQVEQGRVRVSKVYDLPCPPEKFKALCYGLTKDPPMRFSEREWAGKNKPFTGPEWRKLQAEMKRRELIVLRDPSAPKQGYELTAAGMELARKVAASPTPEP